MEINLSGAKIVSVTARVFPTRTFTPATILKNRTRSCREMKTSQSAQAKIGLQIRGGFGYAINIDDCLTVDFGKKEI